MTTSTRLLAVSVFAAIGFTDPALATGSAPLQILHESAAAIDYGRTIATGNGWLAIAAPGERDHNGNYGVVHLYEKNGTWQHRGELSAADLGINDTNAGFGKSLSIYYGTLVVGAPGYDINETADAGAAFIFTLDDAAGTWQHAQTLVSANPSIDGAFGFAVDLHWNEMLVGAPQADHSGEIDAGEAWLFTRDWGNDFIPSAVLRRPVRGRGRDHFGHSVAVGMGGAGENAIIYAIAAPYADTRGIDSGDVYLFTDESGYCNYCNRPRYVRSLNESRIDQNDFFGLDIAMDRNLLIVGSPYSGNATRPNRGASFIYRLFDDLSAPDTISLVSVWTAYDGNSNRQQANANFGASVDILVPAYSLNDFIALSGAPGQSQGSEQRAGAAFVLDHRSASDISYRQIQANGLDSGSEEGEEVAVAGREQLLLGAPGDKRVRVY